MQNFCNKRDVKDLTCPINYIVSSKVFVAPLFQLFKVKVFKFFSDFWAGFSQFNQIKLWALSNHVKGTRDHNFDYFFKIGITVKIYYDQRYSFPASWGGSNPTSPLSCGQWKAPVSIICNCLIVDAANFNDASAHLQWFILLLSK